jgi:hypothetical protein
LETIPDPFFRDSDPLILARNVSVWLFSGLQAAAKTMTPDPFSSDLFFGPSLMAVGASSAAAVYR